MDDGKPDQPGKTDSGADDVALIAMAQRDAEVARRARTGSGPASSVPVGPRGPQESAQRAGLGEPSAIAGLPAGLPPDSFSGYEILREVHRGGQGVVYQAIQKSTKRKVALKVMREGPFATLSEQARFDREVQILGQLDHPNIVAIHDSGQSGGCHFFVMDYIGGEPLDVWMASGARSVEETLRLFAKVCDAVNAAHLRGITHRDLKPGNIRVDDRGEPHILDFGLAKVAMEGQERAGPAMTLTGQFVGSLPWASPEQAEGIPGNIDLRTDVYSLGVILYHMLTGKFPYEVIGSMRDVLDRILRAEPTRPSAIRRQIDDEVETIVLKCLHKEPGRRYQLAGELGRDIARYLAGEPIEAKRDSTAYMLRKYLRKHWLPAAVATGFIIVVTVGLVVSLMFWGQAVFEREGAEQARGVAEERRAAAEASAAQAVAEAARAEKERDKADRISEFMERTLQGVGPSIARGRDTTMLREMMDAAAKRVEDGELRKAPEAELRLRWTIGKTYYELGAYDSAERALRPAVELARALYGSEHEQVAVSLGHLGVLLNAKGDCAAAEPLLREALELRRKLLGNEHPDVAVSLSNLALVLKTRGDCATAEPLYREALALHRKLLGDEAPEVATALHNLAVLLRAKGEYAAAEPLNREALALRRRLLGNEHPEVASSLNNLALLREDQGHLDEAVVLLREALGIYRKVLGDEHPRTVQSLYNLGRLLQDRGDYAAAEPLLREALGLRRKLLGNEHPSVAASLHNVARLLLDQGDAAAAVPLFREALAIREKRFPAGHPDIASTRSGLAVTLARLHKDESTPLEKRTALMAEVEALLLAAIEATPNASSQRQLRMLSLSHVYSAWHELEPDKGYDQKAAEWRAKLAEWQASTQPATSPAEAPDEP